MNIEDVAGDNLSSKRTHTVPVQLLASVFCFLKGSKVLID
jgi:hypothetical protein